MPNLRALHLGLPLLLLLAGAASRLPWLASPDRVVWDEECFGAAAARYLTGEMSLEFHPPLGKLLIAAGEVLLDAVYQIVEVVGNVAIGDYPIQGLPEDDGARLHLGDG